MTEANVEIEESAEVRQKRFTAAQDCLVVVETPLNDKHFVDSYVVLLFHLVTDFFEVCFVNYGDVELRHHAIRVIRILTTDF